MGLGQISCCEFQCLCIVIDDGDTKVHEIDSFCEVDAHVEQGSCAVKDQTAYPLTFSHAFDIQPACFKRAAFKVCDIKYVHIRQTFSNGLLNNSVSQCKGLFHIIIRCMSGTLGQQYSFAQHPEGQPVVVPETHISPFRSLKNKQSGYGTYFRILDLCLVSLCRAHLATSLFMCNHGMLIYYPESA